VAQSRHLYSSLNLPLRKKKRKMRKIGIYIEQQTDKQTNGVFETEANRSCDKKRKTIRSEGRRST